MVTVGISRTDDSTISSTASCRRCVPPDASPRFVASKITSGRLRAYDSAAADPAADSQTTPAMAATIGLFMAQLLLAPCRDERESQQSASQQPWLRRDFEAWIGGTCVASALAHGAAKRVGN